MRSLLFHQEIKQKRINKIKSKKFHKVFPPPSSHSSLFENNCLTQIWSSVFKAHKLVYRSTLGRGVIHKKEGMGQVVLFVQIFSRDVLAFGVCPG